MTKRKKKKGPHFGLKHLVFVKFSLFFMVVLQNLYRGGGGKLYHGGGNIYMGGGKKFYMGGAPTTNPLMGGGKSLFSLPWGAR